MPHLPPSPPTLNGLLGRLLFAYEKSGGVVDQGVEKALRALMTSLGVSASGEHDS